MTTLSFGSVQMTHPWTCNCWRGLEGYVCISSFMSIVDPNQHYYHILRRVFDYLLPDWQRMDGSWGVWEVCQSNLQTSFVSWHQTTFTFKSAYVPAWNNPIHTGFLHHIRIQWQIRAITPRLKELGVRVWKKSVGVSPNLLRKEFASCHNCPLRHMILMRYCLDHWNVGSSFF